MTKTDVLIIGAGPAGLTAAIYALRAGFKVIVFDKGLYGGQVAITSEVENYPAIEKVSGPDFSINLYNQAVAQGAQIRFEEVQRVSLQGEWKQVFTSQEEYQGKAVIIANGAQRRKLKCEGEQRLTGKGVSYCATCDGAFFKQKEVAVVGGGNTALEDALFLSNLCSHVYLIHRRDEFRGEKRLASSVMEQKNITILYHSEVEQILGEDKVTAINVRNNQEQTRQTVPVSAVFVAIGLEPDNHLFADVFPTDQAGYLIAGEDCLTGIPGVYVAGDSRTKVLRQIITAAADGAVAAVQAGNYMNWEGRGESVAPDIQKERGCNKISGTFTTL